MKLNLGKRKKTYAGIGNGEFLTIADGDMLMSVVWFERSEVFLVGCHVVGGVGVENLVGGRGMYAREVSLVGASGRSLILGIVVVLTLKS